MSLITVNFGSWALGKNTGFKAIIPDGVTEDAPVMFLLHGLSDDYTCWTRLSRIETYAGARGFAVIMPEGDRSFYEDMKYGQAFYTHVAKEVVERARQLFPISKKREKTFIAGLSMGGYGAYKIAMRNPDTYAAACAMSGVLDIATHVENGDWDWEMKLIFGDDRKDTVRGSDADLLALAEKMVSCENAPKLLQFCGADDFLLADNHTFRDHAQSLGLDHIYEEAPGSHTWDFWDLHIQKAMDYFLETMK